MTTEDAAWWQEFLQHRYVTFSAHKLAYGGNSTGNSFSEISMPNTLPNDGVPLNDWFQFENIARRMYDTAHRFTVMLPALPGERRDPLEEDRRVRAGKTNCESGKTRAYDIQCEILLGVVPGGRSAFGGGHGGCLWQPAPELTPPMILSQGFLSEAVLTAGHPQDVSDRYVVGRERFQ